MWKTFYFDGNMAWGLVESKKDWRRIVGLYSGNIARLRMAQECLRRSKELSVPSFGFCIEYTSGTTLGEWANQNEVNLG